jgi:hypothetical protein
VEASQGACISLVVFYQSAASGCPCEGSFDDPSTGQRGEASLGFREFNDLEGDALCTRGLGRLVTGIAVIDIGERDGLAGGVLDGLGQTADLGSIIDVGRRHMQGEQMAERIDGQMQF